VITAARVPSVVAAMCPIGDSQRVFPTGSVPGRGSVPVTVNLEVSTISILPRR
jgi:hypothetical protein